MRRGRLFVRRIRGVLVTLAVIGTALGESTACVTDTTMTAAQMACCVAMGHDCEMAGQEEDCCSADTQSARFFVTGKSVSPQPPAAWTVAWASDQAPTFGVPGFESRTFALTGSPQRGRRPVPTYLRLSSLLI
jgi:hypothetical protein